MLTKRVKYGSIGVSRSANKKDVIIQVIDSLNEEYARACLATQDVLELIEDLKELLQGGDLTPEE